MSNKDVSIRYRGYDHTQGAVNSVVKGQQRVNNQMKTGRVLQASWNKGLNANRRMVQQMGFQMTDFATQVAGGQSAMLAFTQQGGQMLQFFGPFGAIAAAALAVFGSLSIALTRSGQSIGVLAPMLTLMSDDIAAIASAWRSFVEILVSGANLVVNNLTALLSSAVMVGLYFGIKWVAASSMAANAMVWFRATVAAAMMTTRAFGVTAGVAAVGVSVLNVAMTAFRAILMSLGIPALVIGIGWLIQGFLRLRKEIGSAGEVLVLLKDVAIGALSKMGYYLTAFVMRNAATWLTVKADGIEALLSFINWLPKNYVNAAIGALVAPYHAAKAVWQNLPALFRQFGAMAVNGLIDGLSGMIGVLAAPVNYVREALGKEPLPAPDLSAWKKTVPEAADIGAAVKDAYTRAVTTDYVGAITKGLGQEAEATRAAADTAQQLSNIFTKAAQQPIEAWEKLKQVWSDSKSDIDLRSVFGGNGAPDAPGGGGGGKPGATGGKGSLSDQMKTEADRIKKIFDDMQKTISDSMLSSFKAVLKGTKSLGDAAMDILSSIIDKVIDLLMQPIFNKIAGNIAGNLLGGLKFAGASFEGGGYTGSGVRAGGVDGKGGRYAIVHPNETVTDHEKGGRAGGTTVVMNISTPDAGSFRASERQIVRRMQQQMGAV